MGTIIEIRDLAVAFGKHQVLQQINLDIEDDRITVVVGPSGSGKTTLLRAVNRLNELYTGCQTEGTVKLHLDGRTEDVYNETIDLPSLRRRAAMVFQTPNVLPVSIGENILIPLKVTLRLPKTEAGDRMEKALKDVHLWEEIKDRCHDSALTLSGGQQQRLCLARALALGPSILLLDEPTASLDFKAARRIEELLSELREHYTIVFVSHSLGQACRLADRAVVLRDGRIIEQIDHETLSDPAHFQKTMEENF